MESRASSKSNLSESSSFDFDTMCQNTAKLDEMMLSIKRGENVPCKACNKRTDTLARREEVAWQREEIIHTREKELREWELMIEEKSRVLNEKEKKLTCDEEKVLQIESVYNSAKNSRKSSLSDIGQGTSTLEKFTKENIKNEFVLEREKLLQEKEKIVFEKMENMEKKEKSIALKEQQLSNQRIIFNKERELLAQKNHSLDLREQVVKKVEEAVDRKLNSIYEEKKSLDERNVLLTQKENVLSTAAECVENKERFLNERENMIIEKERNIIQQISNLVKLAKTEPSDEENKELVNKFDEIFAEKWKSIQERENTVVNSEQILLQKWKECSEAKELLKSEEESLQVIRGTFEKEKNILRGWEKLLEKQEKVINGKYELITGDINNDRSFVGVESVKTWPSSVNVQTKTDLNMNRSSPFGAVGQILNGDINLKLSAENVDLPKDIPDSENREISGDELFQFFEKGKESLCALLLENADTSTNTGESSNSEKNQVLTETVKAFFNKKINITSGIGVNTGVQVVPVPEINSKTTQLLLDFHGERNKGETLQDDVLNNAAAFNSQNKCSVNSENQFIEDSSSVSSKKSVILPVIYKETDEKSNVVLSGAEIDTTVKIIDKKDYKLSEIYEAGDQNYNTAQNSTDSQNHQGGSESQDASKASSKIEKEKAENESHVKNGNDLDKTGEVSYTRVSPALSTCSSRSLTSPISGRSSPWVGRKRKPLKGALLEAISKRNFLETVQLLDTNCMSLEVRNEEGCSAALLAVKCGNIELVERLMNKGADIRACDYKGYSALHMAVTENNSEMVLFLLKKGLNPLVTDINGNTAVKLASDLKFVTLSDVMNKYITAKRT